ncbi:hypothetical protein ABEB36_002320 [Hypothenemus hampei]|uniref:MD-2-related lipid-recognition domain-containing protein n=1 Tax=Hypothenemus hampei TaxID=57062 RepID=A0ABD1F5B4_HYPHA
MFVIIRWWFLSVPAEYRGLYVRRSSRASTIDLLRNRAACYTMKCLLLGIFGVLAVCTATQVSQCPGENFDQLQEKITVGSCTKPPCRLRKNTRIHLTMKFQPEFDYKNLTQVVNANILGIAFPFVGVDGTPACDKIYEEDGETKNNCQFHKGKTYVFKDGIDVLQIYPKVKTVVHWAIVDKASGKNVICFEVPARITN